MKRIKVKANTTKELQDARFASRSRGFSLVEALVAISVLLISIAGPMALAQRGISTAVLSKDQVTAFFLGQEAIEYVRYVRDTDTLQGNNWLNDLSVCVGVYCTVDVTKDLLSKCPGGSGSCVNLRRDTISGLYGHDLSWEATRFNREFTLTVIRPGEEISVNVRISWTTGKLNKEINLNENIFDWQKQ